MPSAGTAAATADDYRYVPANFASDFAPDLANDFSRGFGADSITSNLTRLAL